MTTVVYANWTMAADSMSYIHGGDCRVPGRVRKIERLPDGGLMGHAGVVREARELRLWLEDPQGTPPDTGESTILIVSPQGHIRIFDGRNEREVDAPFYAIGSGAGPALGALYQGATAEEAVRIACLVDPYSGGEIFSESLNDG